MATPEPRLRPYQQAAVEAVKQSWRAFDRTLVCMATGLGKTKLAVELANQWTAGLASEYGRPARVLWLAHRDELIQQAAAELELATGAPPGIEKADRTTAGVKLLDRIVVASIQTLYRESRLESVNPKTIGMVVGDEIHHAPAKSWEKVLDGFPGTKLVGLSVGPDSRILLQVGGAEVYGKISSLWELAKDASYTTEEGWRFPCNWRARALDGNYFTWKNVRGIYRHKAGTGHLLRIRTDRGRELEITTDHSVYRLERFAYRGVRGGPRVRHTLKCVSGGELKVGDYLILENSLDCQPSDALINVTAYLSSLQYVVYGDFASVVDRLYPSRQGQRRVGNTAKVRYSRKRGKHGTYLTLTEYRMIGGTGIIGLPGRGNTCATHVPIETLAYLLGFYIGDGWASESRLTFAVETRRLPQFVRCLETLRPWIDSTVQVNKARGESYEVSIGNRPLRDLLTRMAGKGAAMKHIPNEVFGWPLASVQAFIRGMMESDGHLRLGKQRRSAAWHYVTVSEDVALGLVELLKRCNVCAGIHRMGPRKGGVVRGRQIMGKRTRYTVHFADRCFRTGVPYREQSPPWCRCAPGVPVRITSIVRIPETKYVYDISMEDKSCPNFVASGFLVHNTATCDRTDEIALGKVLQDCAYDYRLMDAVTDGWACPIRQEYIEVGLDFSSVGISNGDLSAEAIGRIIEEESPLHTIAAATSRLSGDRQTMVFCPTVAVTRALAAVLSRYATKAGQRGAVAAWGAMPEEARGQVVQAYLSGEAQFLLNCFLFVEGFNSPQTSHIVIARPTRSRMLMEQMIGRGTRGGPLCPIPGKADLLVTDLVGAGFKCKLVHAGDVLGGKYDAVVVDTVNRWAKEAADEDRPADVAALVRKAILDADELRRRQRMEIIAEARLKRREVDPFAALDVRNEATAGWWQGMPPSAAQIAALEGEGIKTKGLNREECSRLIEEIRKRREAGLCSYRQLRRLSGYGYGPQTTAVQAAEAFEDLRRRGWKHTRQEIVNWRRRKKTAGRQAAKPQVPPKSGPPEGWF